MRRFGAVRWAAFSMWVAVALCSVACGGDDDGPAPSDAGRDARVETPDAGGSDAGGCDLGTPPADLPEIAGVFDVASGDGGSNVPVATGGDPTGTWVFDEATFYVTPEADSMFDRAASSVTGTAWVALDGTEARLDFQLVTTLATEIAGTIVRASSTRIRGSYVVDGASIAITPSCVESGGGGSTGLQFSIDGDRGTLITGITGMVGSVTIVLEGTRRSP